MFTTLKNKARPVTDLGFPAITICVSGPHMGTVGKVLYRNFENWIENKTTFNNDDTMKEKFVKYLEKAFKIYKISVNSFN